MTYDHFALISRENSSIENTKEIERRIDGSFVQELYLWSLKLH